MTEKQELLARGIDRMEELCRANALPVPRVDVVPASGWRLGRTCAYYRRDVIRICLERCAHPGRAGRSWSWPGYAVDREPYGVVIHEWGHHVDTIRSRHVLRSQPYRGDWTTHLRLHSGERPLTGYNPDDGEWGAEMLRLFGTNPDLLRLIRPRTYGLIAAELQPIIPIRPWRDVLEGAPDRTIIAAGNRILAAQRG